MTKHEPTADRVTIKGEKFVVLPEAEYESLLDALEDVEDAAAVNAFVAARARGEDAALPRADWDRIHAGESPIRIWRERRKLTQQELADAAGVHRPEISALESGRRRGSVDSLKAIARALNVSLDIIAGA